MRDFLHSANNSLLHETRNQVEMENYPCIREITFRDTCYEVQYCGGIDEQGFERSQRVSLIPKYVLSDNPVRGERPGDGWRPRQMGRRQYLG